MIKVSKVAEGSAKANWHCRGHTDLSRLSAYVRPGYLHSSTKPVVRHINGFRNDAALATMPAALHRDSGIGAICNACVLAAVEPLAGAEPSQSRYLFPNPVQCKTPPE